jgi:hypothetical protein
MFLLRENGEIKPNFGENEKRFVDENGSDGLLSGIH